MCKVCSDLTNKMKSAVDDEQYDGYKTLRGNHRDLQREQRLCYNDNRVKGQEHKTKNLSLITDAFDQGKTYLPLIKRRAKNDKVKLMKQKVMGLFFM